MSRLLPVSQSNGQSNSQSVRQGDRQTNRQTDRQADTWIDREGERGILVRFRVNILDCFCRVKIGEIAVNGVNVKASFVTQN